jgi:predicted P-loop ATPase
MPKTVLDYLDSLVWDGTPRLDRWLIDCAGAEDSPYVRFVSRLILIAAVRRARVPGCTFDQLPVFVGPQGSGKTSALRVLTVEDGWFSDIRPLADERRLVEATDGKWIVEVTDPRLVPTLKAFLARSGDTARLPYHRKVTRVPRKFIAVGTSNTFLTGETGHRRFLPVSIPHFNLERLREERDQLWAEAACSEELLGPLADYAESGLVPSPASPETLP